MFANFSILASSARQRLNRKQVIAVSFVHTEALYVSLDRPKRELKHSMFCDE